MSPINARITLLSGSLSNSDAHLSAVMNLSVGFAARLGAGPTPSLDEEPEPCLFDPGASPGFQRKEMCLTHVSWSGSKSSGTLIAATFEYSSSWIAAS